MLTRRGRGASFVTGGARKWGCSRCGGTSESQWFWLALGRVSGVTGPTHTGCQASQFFQKT